MSPIIWFRQRSKLVTATVITVICLLIGGLLVSKQITASKQSATLPPSSLSDPARKERAAEITSSFENSTTTLQYDYAEDIGDGNGITAGRAGFTSGTGDLLEVIQSYSAEVPDNILAKYIPVLQAVNGSKNTKGLEDFATDWKSANKDPKLHAVQDAEVDKLYFDPAMQRAKSAGVSTALGEAIFWDTWIQQGGGAKADGDPDGGDQLVAETRQAMRSSASPDGAIHGNEAAWLTKFLQIRKQHLYHMYADTLDDKTSSASRIAALQSFIDYKDFGLDAPLQWSVYGDSYSIK